VIGDGEIERLYREHGHVVLRRARELLGSSSEARDALQEVFLGLLARPEQLAGVIKRSAWLYRVTTHHCLNQIRNRHGRDRILRAMSPDEETSPRAEHLIAVRQLLSRLPEPLAEVAVYYYVDEMTHEEIAAMLGCSRRHVGNLMVRMRDAVGSGPGSRHHDDAKAG
jgi:RNA polymerase sigma factor (sigma-70 family)